jgi:hypothetical protein
MRFFLTVVLVVLLVLLLLALAIGVILLWSLGLGWLVARLAPLELFQATLLVLLPTLLFVNKIISFFADAIASYNRSSKLDDIDYRDLPLTSYFDDEETYPIGLEQFTKGKAPVGEDIVMLEFANGIYHRLQDTPGSVGLMGESQVRQLAIRLAEFAVMVVKNKRSGNYQISLTALKKQMEREGQRPYDSDILRLAVEEVNELLDSDEDVVMVTRDKAWRALY